MTEPNGTQETCVATAPVQREGFACSASLAQLAPALARAQRAFPEIEKDKSAKIETRSGGSFSYDYADLATILRHTRPALAENGLAVTQPARLAGNVVTVTTLLLHASGEWMLSDLGMPVSDPKDPKAVASAITYARRYGLSAMLGVAARDEDDDGHAAGEARRQAQRRQEPRRQEARPEPEAPAPRQDEPVTRAQLQRLNGLMEAHGTDKATLGGYIRETWGYKKWGEIQQMHYEAICQLAQRGITPLASEPEQQQQEVEA